MKWNREGRLLRCDLLKNRVNFCRNHSRLTASGTSGTSYLVMVQKIWVAIQGDRLVVLIRSSHYVTQGFDFLSQGSLLPIIYKVLYRSQVVQDFIHQFIPCFAGFFFFESPGVPHSRRGWLLRGINEGESKGRKYYVQMYKSQFDMEPPF